MKRRQTQPNNEDPFGFFDDVAKEGNFECNFMNDDYVNSLLGRSKVRFISFQN